MDEAGDGGDEEDGNSVKKEEEQMVRTPEFCVLVQSFSTFSSFQVKFLFSFKQIFFKAALNSWNTTTSVLTQTTNSRL